MKTNVTYLILVALFYFVGLQPTNSKTKPTDKTFTLDSVQVIEEFKNFYRSGDYYFGGQPTLEAINWLKSEGVELIINLRSEKENEKFTSTAFNEKDLLKESGIEYISIPVSYPDSYTPETIEKFTEALNNFQGKVFIHCASSGRVKLLFMAYLVKHKNYTLNDAINFGKQMEYTFMLEKLLGRTIEWQFEE